MGGAAGPRQGKKTNAAAQLSRPHRVALASKPPAWRPGKHKKRASPPPHPSPTAGKGARPLICAWGFLGHKRCPSLRPHVQSEQKVPVCWNQPSLGDPKAEPGHGQMRFSRQTCSHFKANFSFTVSKTEHFQLRTSPATPESRRKPPQPRPAILCPSDMATAARHHEPPPVP